jgi:membrane fusion protein, multidrug efflux system
MRLNYPYLTLLTLLASPVTSGAMAQQPAQAAIEVHAQLVPRQYTTLSSETAGSIDHLAVREGDSFKEGQLLVHIDCSQQRAQLDEAQAILGAAEQSRSVNKRMLELKSGGVLEANLSAAEVVKAQAKMHSIQVVLSKCSVTAPYQGRVVEQKVREHQYVQAGQPMLEILDDSALEVEFIAPSRWLAWIRAGSAFQIQVDETGASYGAKVSRVGAKVDAVSHSVKIIGEITGKTLGLTAGMSGLIRVEEPE